MKVKIKLVFRSNAGDVEGTVVEAVMIAPRHLGLASHRSLDGEYWVVSDRVTGMMVGCGMTRESARLDALDRLTARAGISRLSISALLTSLRIARLSEIKAAA